MSILNAIFSNTAFCNFDGPTYLLFSSNVAPLVHYSHIPITIISLILGFFILFQNRKGLPNRILFCLTLAFSAWVFLDSVFWASNRSDVIMFVWSLQILFEPIVYISALYLVYVLIKKEDISFNKKLLIALIYLPVIVFVPTKYSLSGFDVATCLSNEGPIAIYYTYAIEILYTLWIIGFSVREYIKGKTKEAKQEILLLTAGTILLLLAFSFGNIISSFTEDWKFAQIGLFAMPVFIGFLVYSIVKYGTFNIKLFSSIALVCALGALSFAQIFVQSLQVFHIVAAATFVLVVVFGITLIRSIVKDVRNQLHIAELNKARSDFLYIASHQLRTPVTVIKGNLSVLVEGDYDDATVEQRHEVYNSMFHKANKLTNVVNGILAASHMDNFEEFKMSNDVTIKDVDVRALTKEICENLKDKADEKKIELDYSSVISSTQPIIVKGSDNYLEQAISNLLDNAINYTQQGFVRVALSQTNNRLTLQITDSGIGIPVEDQSRLFGKFERGKNARNAYTDGSGLGLFVVKKVVEAHPGGRISFKSEGEGKGTTFIVELKTS